jgi:hypothetical protein
MRSASSPAIVTWQLLSRGAQLCAQLCHNQCAITHRALYYCSSYEAAYNSSFRPHIAAALRPHTTVAVALRLHTTLAEDLTAAASGTWE